MKKPGIIGSGLVLLVFIWFLTQCQSNQTEELYAGTQTCRVCHEKFYQLWAPSHHGTAMQGVDSSFIGHEIQTNGEWISVQGSEFTTTIRNDSLFMIERTGDQATEYPAIHALGGKYIYYFLTPLQRGKLQVLPLAYDVEKQTWYNTPASAVRHFVDPIEDEELDWRSFAYTFNTSCHSCHVSQLSSIYDPESDTYHTTWREPGINCETCHGPSAEHIRVCEKAPEGEVPEDLKIIQTSVFSPDQHNSSCGPCHAKMRPLTHSFMPGDRFFDHFDLTTLEDPDFYPDGRDLGENYTYTTWLMSGCVQNGDLHCVHCHTSSGRYRFRNGNPNQACLPCHQERVDEIWAHSHHPPGSQDVTCIACHMPKTHFARMERSDHSMRPPMPGSSLAFGSPNACNLCHTDQDTAWADEWVNQWTDSWDQHQVIHQGQLLLQARNNDWGEIEEITRMMEARELDEVYLTSFIRLLGACEDPMKWRGIIPQLDHPSPLVRSAAVQSLGQMPSPETKQALLQALNDEYRIVRRAAMSSITQFPGNAFSPQEQEMLQPFLREYETAFMTRPDDWASHYNLGNFYQNQDRFQEAMDSYEKALSLHPEAIAVLVNQSYTLNLLNKKELALNRLYRAKEIDPDNEAVNLNFAMLMGELGRLEEAETALRRALNSNPTSAQAAYNLGVILADRDSLKSLEWIAKASRWAEGEPRYIYSYAYYLYKYGQRDDAVSKLEQMTQDFPYYAESWILLGTIYYQEKRVNKARQLMNLALHSNRLSDQDKERIREVMAEWN